MQVQLVSINKLKNNTGQIEGLPKNPRLLKDDKFKKLVKSIQDDPEMLELREVIAYDNNGELVVIAGNMRLKACQEIGIKEIPTKILPQNTPVEKLKAYTIKDNVAFGEHNWDDLANNWDAQELTDWGLDIPNFDVNNLEAEEDDYAVPDGGTETDIVLGDLFEIGEHRLLCGDSTDSDQVAKLMNGQKADMVFTDPPYGIGYEYNSHKDTKGEEYLKFCEEWFNVLQLNCELIIITTGWSYKSFWWNKNPSDELVWFDKTKQSGGRSYYLRKTEPIFIFGKIKEKYTWDILEIQSNRGDGMRELHTCPKPITLIADLIKPQTINNSIILDIFLGSGTTMVASHQLGRKCYGTELDPKYCQVIVDRMRKLDPSLVIKKNGVTL